MDQKQRKQVLRLLFCCIALHTAAASRVLQQHQAQQLTAWQQCGGINACSSADNCGDRPWPRSYCPGGYSCQRNDQYYWQCRPGSTADTKQQQQSNAVASVNAWGQCGGISCSQGTCSDKVWATCPSGYICQRQDQWYYQCKPESWVAATNTQTLQEQAPKPSGTTGFSFQSLDQAKPQQPTSSPKPQTQPANKQAATKSVSSPAPTPRSPAPAPSKPGPAGSSASSPSKHAVPDDEGIVVEEVDESVINRVDMPAPQPPPPQQQSPPAAGFPGLFSLFG